MWLRSWSESQCRVINKTISAKLDVSFKKIQNTKKIFHFPNAELGNLFYGTTSLIFYLISLCTTITHLKRTIITQLIKFSISNYNYFSDNNKSNRISFTYNIDTNVKAFLIENFLLPIIFLFVSILFALAFTYCILYQIGNISNDDKQLGVNLILVDTAQSQSLPSSNSSSIVLHLNELEENSKSSFSLANSSPSSISPIASPLISSPSRSSSSPIPNDRVTKESEDFIDKKINILPKTKPNADVPTHTVSFSSEFFNAIVNKKKPYCRNVTGKSKIKCFYFPAFNSCFHLAMCMCLLVTRLLLHQHEFESPTTSSETIGGATTTTTQNEFLKSNLNSLKLIKYFYMNRNNTQLIDGLFRELNQKIISNKHLKLDKKRSTEWTATRNTSDLADNFLNKFQIDCNYMNYFLAFLVLMFKSTRVYSKMNRLYASLVFVHLLLFALLNLTTYPAFELLFKVKMKTKLIKSATSSLSIIDSIRNENFILNSNLHRLVPSLFDNKHFMLSIYLLSWTLNLVYLATLNFFATSFYKDAQWKIKLKFENYLNYWESMDKSKSPVDDRKIIYDNNLFNSFQQHTRALTLFQSEENASGTKQYKAIIAGILAFVVCQIFRLPLIYSCYIKYFIHSFDTYLFALMFQLIYLMYNAVFWIILSFRKEWLVNFTSEFRILLWHHLYCQHFNKTPKKFHNLQRGR